MHLRLGDMFTILSRENPSYVLKAMVIFTHNHYFSIVRTANNTWMILNDRLIEEVRSWQELCLKIIECKFHPVLLTYEMNDVAQVDLSS